MWGVFAAGLAAFALGAGAVVPPDMAPIGAGDYTPLYKEEGEAREVHVEAFLLDRLPVSNADFAAFTREDPRWAPDRVKPVFADAGYLSHWQGHDPMNPEDIANQPVTNVSWFAARAYCRARGKRLPSLDEWEWAAMASEDSPRAGDDPAFQARVLDWYGTPAFARLPDVADTWENFWGVRGMHGATWELVNDFNTALVSGESRADSELDNSLFCGAGAAAAVDPSDYAAFMRYAFRSSYSATSSIRSLGFRCARDLVELETTNP